MIRNAKVVGENNFSQMKKLIAIGVVALIVLVIFAASVTIVPQDTPALLSHWVKSATEFCPRAST